MAKVGRPNKYFTHVRPRFDEIEKWIQEGATEKEICANLHVNDKVFIEYKKQFPELNDLIVKSRRKPVNAIKAALFNRAIGYHYKESTVEKSEKGKKTIEYTRYLPPDPACAMILLKHWDKETVWTNDPATLRLKREEFEFKKKHIEESEEWS